MRYFIAFFLLFISAFSSAQTELLDAKKIWVRDSIRLGSNWIRSVSKDTALLTVTDRDIPSAKAVKDFVLNRKANTDSLLNLKMDKTDSTDLLSKTVRTFGNQSGILGNKSFTNNITANSFIKASGTADQLLAANGDVQSKADIHNGAFTFDTTGRLLTIQTLGGGTYSVLIPRGTASGAEGITALTSSKVGNLVTVFGDNGSSTTFSIRDADSAITARLSDSTLFNAGRWLPNRSEDSIKVLRTLINTKGVGTVTSVNASGPLSSSGGATPNITISQANTSTNGFLSSTDWNTFNNKVSYTDALARGAVSFTAGSGAYNSTTGVITIPTNTNQITNGSGFITLNDSSTINAGRWLPNRSEDSIKVIRDLANSKGVGSVTSVAVTAGTGISVTGSPITGAGTINVVNTAPDQVVTLTAGTGISVSGTYPNFTVTNTSSSTGTVTSVGLTAPTGFNVSSSPITSAGTIGLSFASGYSLPTTASQSLWDVAYNKRLISASLSSSTLTLTLGDASTVTTSVPTFNQNTTGTAGSLSEVLSSTLGGAGSVNGILKANGSGTVSAAVAGTDYVAPSALSSYVPYTGATTSVNLGSNNLSAGLISGTSASISGLTKITGGTISSGTELSLAWNATTGGAIQTFASQPLTLNPLGNNIILGGALSGTSAAFSSNIAAGGDLTFPINLTTRTIWNNGYGGAVQLRRSDASTDRFSRIGIVDNSGAWVGGLTISSDQSAIFSNTLTANNTFSVGTSGGVTTGIMSWTGASNGTLSLYDGGVSKISFTATGNSFFNGGDLGIGTSSPNYKLDVNIGAGNTGVVARFNAPTYDEVNISAGLSNWIGTNGASSFSIRTSNTNRLTVDGSTGAITASSSITATAGVFSGGATISGFGTISNAANRLNLDFATGNSRLYSLGANTSTKGGFEFHTISSDGSLDVTALAIAGSTGAITANSSITATSFFESSDARLKNVIRRDGDVAYFKWKDGQDNKVHIGYIAQEVQKSNPNQVKADDKGFLSVNYTEVLVEKVRSLEKRISELENRNK